VFSVRYQLGFYITEDSIHHSHRRENLKSFILQINDIKKISRRIQEMERDQRTQKTTTGVTFSTGEAMLRRLAAEQLEKNLF
jgi:hypothetical protein